MLEELTTLASTTAKPLVDVFSLEEPFAGGDKLYASEMNQIVNEIQGALEYNIDEDSGTVTILGFKGCPSTGRTLDTMTAFNAHRSVTILNIPESIGGRSVTGIAAYAFAGCDKLVKIKLPSSLTTIGTEAFKGCSSLVSIIIPDNVTSMGADAFTNLLEITCSGNHFSSFTEDLISQLQVVTFTTGTIPCRQSEGTSSWFRSLQKVTIGRGVTEIQARAFYKCDNLTEIIFEGGRARTLSILPHMCFQCRSLKELSLPRGVQLHDASYAFASCSSLQSLNWFESDSIEELSNTTEIGAACFQFCSNLTIVSFPNSLTTIGEAAFYQDVGLTSCKFPASLTKIEKSAFQSCKSLTALNLQAPITIGEKAFESCSSLTRLQINGGDKGGTCTIGGQAFNACSLSNLHLGTNINLVIGASAFVDNPISLIRDYGISLSELTKVDFSAFNRVPIGVTIYSVNPDGLKGKISSTTLGNYSYGINTDTGTIKWTPSVTTTS